MSYVLDTDHLTLLRKGHAEVVARVAATPQTDIAITIISIEEQFRGWFTQVRKARDAARLARAYAGLFDVIDMAKRAACVAVFRCGGRSLRGPEKNAATLGKAGSRNRFGGVGIQCDARDTQPAGLRTGAESAN